MSTELHTALAFEQCVPRTLAHRRAVGEVFVTDTSQVGPEEYLAAIQLPRAHSLYFDRTVRSHDPLSAVEAIRQALIVIGQRYLQLPSDAPASLQRLDCSVEDLSLFADDERNPLEGIVRFRPVENSSSSTYLRDVTFEASLTIGAALAMTVRCGVVVFPRDIYLELRTLGQAAAAPAEAPGPAEPVAPEAVGRMDRRNVAVARRGERLVLVVDQRHPSFFDHPYDHVPGPLLLEGFRQAALVAAVDAGLLDSPVAATTAVDITFAGFAELDAPLEFVVDTGDEFECEVALELQQSGRQVAAGRIELTPYP